MKKFLYVSFFMLLSYQICEAQSYYTRNPIYNGYYGNNYYNYSGARQNYRTPVLRRIKNYFVGEMTGFTPPVNTYPNINPNSYPYERSNQSYYSTPFGSGYRINNYNSGYSGSVRILD